jgi:UDP-N-acetylmuramoylalanine--D-glutamate ligase
MEEYLHYKMRIFENQTDSDFAVLNFSDKTLREKSKNLKAKVFYFSPDKEPERGAYAENGKIYFVDNGVKEPVIPVSEIKLRGKHNVENVLAAVLSAKLFGLTNDVIREGVGTFKGLEHRLEEVRMLNGVLYVNDSKATTPDSVIKALNSFNEKIVLIAGGSSKNNDFTKMAKLFPEKLRKLILIGETAPDIANSALESGFSDIVFATDLKEAVLLSKKIAKSGDVVLLSPACASFDMFADFEDRGRQFKEIVKDL